MKSKEAFGLAIRLLGLVFLYHALREIPTYVAVIGTAVIGVHLDSLVWTTLHGAWPFAIAYWLLRGAPLLMRTAYPDASSRPENGHDVAGAIGQKADG